MIQARWSYSIDATVSESLYLMPGALYVGNEVEEIKTLLGSCVAVILWHPADRLAGMTHIVLPSSAEKSGPRYATDAIKQLSGVIKQHGYGPAEFEVSLYGGGLMFSVGDNSQVDVGKRNVEMTLSLLQQAGYLLKKSDVLGAVYRHVTLNRQTGQILLKSTDVSATMG